MLNNKTHSTAYIQTKAFSYPLVNKLQKIFASKPHTPTNSPSSSYAGNGDTVKFYISSSSSSLSEIDSNDRGSTCRRYTL